MARIYRLYGCRIESDLPFQTSAGPRTSKQPDIRILKTKATFFSQSLPKPRDGYRRVLYHSLPGGAFDIIFFNAYQCRIAPDGKTVYFRKLSAAKNRRQQHAARAFPFFLRNNVLSFCLLKFGLESLHGSAVAVNGMAAGLIGESTFGKSTLAAAFLQAGHPVLTDDLLAIRKSRGRFWSAPGIPHLKLRPEAAKAFLPREMRGIGMTPGATKFIYPLKGAYACRQSLPIGVLYVLQPRSSSTSPKIRIRSFSHREAVIQIIGAAHNLVVQDRQRIRRQFEFAGDLAAQVPVRGVSFPRDFKRVPELRDLLLRDIAKITFCKPKKEKFQREKFPAG